MTIEDILNDARSVVKKVVPDHVEITQVDFEGPTIVIYTKNMEVFAESNDLVRQIAQQLRRRIVVRPDPSLLAPQDEAEKVIREVISEDNGSPYLHEPEVLPLSSLDAVVITHAHLDHSGLVPALFKYGYEGPIYTTPPTRDLMSLLQLDFIKVAMGEARKSAYDSSNIRKAVANTIPLKYGETTDIAPDVRLTFQNAGHILGSAVAHFHIGDGLYNVAMSGDIKFEKTWLFNPAVNKFPRLETLVLESTYGGYHDVQPSRHEAAQQLKEVLRRVLTRGGKVLIPVFAVGRSQEVMLVLEDAMRNRQIPEVPIYLDGMIWEATAIHTAYPEYLNSQLRTQIFQTGENPFLSPMFKRVETADVL